MTPAVVLDAVHGVSSWWSIVNSDLELELAAVDALLVWSLVQAAAFDRLAVQLLLVMGRVNLLLALSHSGDCLFERIEHLLVGLQQLSCPPPLFVWSLVILLCQLLLYLLRGL